MGLRPGKCYRKLERPYTRISITKPRKGYVKGVPASKIHRFESGKDKPEFTVQLFLVAKNAVQIRHNALEAARVAVTQALGRELTEDAYFTKILVYPHHVIRENPLASGAGADRFQTGMRQSFGRPIGVAARVRCDQKLMEVKVSAAYEKLARKALIVASSKMPTPCYIEVKK
jgi:large subunit ribosomal protein L10e